MEKVLNAIIKGTGHAVPSQVIDNNHFAKYLDTSDEWITTRTGIKQRYRAGDDENTVTLAKEASLKAIEDARIRPDEIDLIIFATATPNTLIPASACWLQGELGIGNVPAVDINAACAGLIYAIIHSAMYLHCGAYRNVLVIGAETLSRFTDNEDRTTCVLFGDAACAVVMSPCDDTRRGVLYQSLGADGSKADYIWAPAGGAALPTSEMTVRERLHLIKMRGREVYKFAVVKFNQLVEQMLDETGINPEQIDRIVPHQSNLRIIESVRAKLGLPEDKFVVNIERYGNTSAASVGLALDEARRDGRIKEGDVVLMIALGAGLTWGLTLFRM